MAGKIYVTGDCHGDFSKLNSLNKQIRGLLDKDDYLIICGDFGLIWKFDGEDNGEKHRLDSLEEESKFTILFVDGNHENFDRLNKYSVKEWNGGLVHEIRPSILHLMRGQIFDIAGNKIFVMGGARSHDISGGLFELDDPMLDEKVSNARKRRTPFRIVGMSWWKQELPSEDEYEEAIRNLEANDFKVDYILTHCCASSSQSVIDFDNVFDSDELTDWLELLKQKCKYKHWYFGHYHLDWRVSDCETVLYNDIIELGDTIPIKSYIPGHPKYKRGEIVLFLGRENETISGEIEIVDRYGSFTRPDEPSYDIFVREQNMLYKHVPETDVIEFK